MKKTISIIALGVLLLLPTLAKTQTQATALTNNDLPRTFTFEDDDDADYWTFSNDDANGWFIGQATHNGGTHALYVSNDNGVSNSYTTSRSGYGSGYSFAWLTITLTESGEYALSFDWKCAGESSYDYMYAYIAPSTATITGGGTAPTTTGWTQVGSRFNQQTAWQTFSDTWTVTDAMLGTYYLVFMWKNDYSDGNQPPAALDNVHFEKITCPQPMTLVFSNRLSDGFTVSWTEMGDATEWSVYVNGELYDNTVVSGTPTVTLTGLDANTEYQIAVRSNCGVGDTSMALTGSYTTDCANGSCDIQVSGAESYYGMVNVYQNGAQMAHVTSSSTVEICNGDSLIVLYEAGQYASWSTVSITVVDAAGTELVSNWSSSGHSTGDTLLAVASGCPSCMPVSNLRVSDADTDYFTVAWTGPSNAQGYILYIDSVEVTDYDGTSTSYTLENLTNSNRHQVMVRVDCGNSDSSSWRSIGASATCTFSHISADDEAEFYESFAGIDGTFGGTVHYNDDHTASHALMPCWYFSGNNVWPKEQELMFENATDYACLPVMDAPINTLEITYWAKVGNIGDSPDSVVIGVADVSGENVEWLDTIFYPGQSRATGAQHPWYRFENYNGTGVRFAIKPLFGSVWNSFKNFHVRQIPQCFAPLNLTGHNYSDVDSTYYTWTSQGSATEWEVVVTDADATVEDVEAMTPTTTSDPSYVIPQGTLTFGQEYTIWVRSDCGVAQSEWVSHTFYSGTVVMPSSGTDSVSGCNLVVYDNGYQGPYSGTSTLIVRPAVAGQLVGISGGWFHNYCYEGSCQGTLTVYDGEGTNGTVLLTMSTRDSIADTILGEEGSLTIRLQAGQYVGNGCEIHTFCTDAPTCFRPKHLTVSGIDSTSVTLSWDNANASDYIVYYRVDTAGAEWETLSATAISDSTYTFPDNTLAPATNYRVKLAGDCGNGDISLQSAEVGFRTACSGDFCQVSVSFSASYYTCDYELIQNGYSFGLTDNSATYDVCAGMPLTVHTVAGSYGTSDFVLSNVADIELLRLPVSQSVDTVIAQPCPSCLPAIALHVDSTTADGGTISWSPMGSNTDWRIYLDGVEEGTTTNGDTSYTFTGLDANTAYTVGVRADCDDGDSSILRTVTMRTACAGGNCTFTIVMQDSYSDGWNGASIGVYQNGDLLETATIASGSANTQTFAPCLGDPVVLLWQGGNYDDEASFSVKDAADSVLLTVVNGSQCSNGDTLVVFDGLCNATVLFVPDTTTPGPQPGSCNAPAGLSTTVTETTVTVSFNAVGGYIDGYEVDIVAGAWSGPTGNRVFTNATTYTFSGLQPATQYTVAVRTVCDSLEYDGYSAFATSSATTAAGGTDECEAPSGLAAASVTATGATIRWTENGSATRWELELNASDFDTIYTVTRNPYTVTGLRPSHTYRMRVRAVCSDTERSAWDAGEASFQTLQGQGIDGVDMLGVSLFPNPATDKVTLLVGERAVVTLIDLNGRVSGVWDVEDGRLTFDVSQMAQGAYFVRVVGESGVAVRKLVVR